MSKSSPFVENAEEKSGFPEMYIVEHSLRWAMIFLGLFIITGGILLGGLLHSYTSDSTADFERRYWVWRHYGTASRVSWL